MKYRITTLNLAFAVAAGLAISPLAAQAADMPVKSPRYKAPLYQASTWTGWYVGLNAGYGFGSGDVSLAPTSANFGPVFAAGGVPSTVNLSSSGFIFGAQVGYNYQWAASWVVGAELDVDYSTIKGDNTVDLGPVGGFVPSVTTVEHKMDWFGTARLRAGYLPFDPLLIYVTGGLAVGDVKDSASISFPAVGQSFAGSSSGMKWGWTVGLGAEWAFLAHWSAKAEYL